MDKETRVTVEDYLDCFVQKSRENNRSIKIPDAQQQTTVFAELLLAASEDLRIILEASRATGGY